MNNMSEFTYETKNRTNGLETYEWDNVWLDHPYDDEAVRILYIGDSISCGTRTVASEATGRKMIFDGFGTSKALDNPYFKDALHLFALQQAHRDAVLFNNGLHGWHLSDDTEYAQYYEDFVKFLLSEFPETPLLIVLTTFIKNEADEKRVQIRNKVASEIAEKYKLPVVDLYTTAKENADLLIPDGVHFSPKGYQKLAATVIDAVKNELK